MDETLIRDVIPTMPRLIVHGFTIPPTPGRRARGYVAGPSRSR